MSSPTEKGKSRARETLDVEDEDSRVTRLGGLLEQLNQHSLNRDGHAPTTGPAFDFGDRTTFAVDPPSELLARVQAFLPQIETANVETAQQAAEDPDAVDIENLNPDLEQYIEMNLGLGVFENRDGQTNADEQDETMSTDSSDASSETTSEDTSSEGSDTDSLISADSDDDTQPSRPTKPLPKRARPLIEVLDDGTPSSGTAA